MKQFLNARVLPWLWAHPGFKWGFAVLLFFGGLCLTFGAGRYCAEWIGKLCAPLWFLSFFSWLRAGRKVTEFEYDPETSVQMNAGRAAEARRTDHWVWFLLFLATMLAYIAIAVAMGPQALYETFVVGENMI